MEPVDASISNDSDTEEEEEEEEEIDEALDALFQDDSNEVADSEQGSEEDQDSLPPVEFPPEGAALILPTDVNRYFDRTMTRARNDLIRMTIVKHVRHISAYCSWLLAKLLTTDPDMHRLPTDSEKERLQRCFDEWHELWITQGNWINEMRFLRIPALPTTPEEEIDDNGMRKVRSCLGENLFPELCRMWFLIHYGNLRQQRDHVRAQKINVCDMPPADVPTVHWALSHTQEEFWLEEWPQLWPRHPLRELSP